MKQLLVIAAVLSSGAEAMANSKPAQGFATLKVETKDYGKHYQVYQQDYPDGVNRAQLHKMIKDHAGARGGEGLAKLAHATKTLALMKVADVAAWQPAYSKPKAGNWLMTMYLESDLRRFPALSQSFDYREALKWQYLALGQHERAAKLHNKIPAAATEPMRRDQPCYDFLYDSFTKTAFSELSASYDRCAQSGSISYFKRPASSAWAYIQKVKRPFASYEEYAQTLAH